MTPRQCRRLLARDLRLFWRAPRRCFQPALFALLAVVLFALAAGGEREPPHGPRRCGWRCCSPACSRWTACSAATPRTVSLEQWILAPVPLPWLVAVRVFMHWLTTSLPVLSGALPGELLFLPRAQLPVL